MTAPPRIPVDTTDAAPGLPPDWLDRLYERAPVAPWVVGLTIAFAMLALFAVMTSVSGEMRAFFARGESVVTNRNARLGLLLPFLVAYAPTAQCYLRRASRRNLAALTRSTGVAAPAVGSGLRGPWLAFVSVSSAAAVAFAIDRDLGLYFRSHYWTGATVANWWVGILSVAVILRFGAATSAWSRTFSRAAERIEHVDLLDREWLAPFARQGLFCALLWLLAPAVFSLNLGDASLVLVVIPVTLSCAAVGTAALWLPTAGVRRRLVEAKRVELAHVHDALRGDRAALQTLAVSGPDRDPSLADLLAYERFVRDVPTMPFDQSSWIRFGVYLALPLGSWLGGALVERVVSGVLD